MTLSAIIVSYKVQYYLAQCILSLFKAGRNMDLEILVIDNDSQDGTENYLRTVFPDTFGKQLLFIANTGNEGFGKANNKALLSARGKYILFINPDTFVSEDTLDRCVRFLDSHPQAGTIGVRMLNPNGTFARESRRGVPTLFTAFCKISGLNALFPHSRLFNKYHMGYMDEKEMGEIDIASGAFMMIPKHILDTIGAFDEQFFMYGEDVELSYRIQKNGYRNYYIPTRILHYKGESTDKHSRRYVNVFYKAMLIFFKKHYPKARLLYATVFSAVYLLSLKAIVMQRKNKLQAMLRHKDNMKAQYAFFGSERMLEKACKICIRYHLDGLFFPSEDSNASACIDRIKETGRYTFLVYDMETYTYKDILQAFDDTPRKDLIIGTAYADLNLFITHFNTFTLK
jgi:N-acetylglucosaminyl-diphospho-decaprenol L-rhamnosyltransferase